MFSSSVVSNVTGEISSAVIRRDIDALNVPQHAYTRAIGHAIGFRSPIPVVNSLFVWEDLPIRAESPTTEDIETFCAVYGEEPLCQ